VNREPGTSATAPTGGDCAAEVCITCSDVAIPVRIRALLDAQLAQVDTEAGPEEVSVALVEAGPGDLVLVHAKEAIAVVEKAP
jgi:hydrogenase expression/formation protein HypC